MAESVTRKSGEPLRNFTIELSKAQAEVQAEQLVVLRHPTRQWIIKLLEKYNDRRLCVFEIADVLEISYGAISRCYTKFCVMVHSRKARKQHLD